MKKFEHHNNLIFLKSMKPLLKHGRSHPEPRKDDLEHSEYKSIYGAIWTLLGSVAPWVIIAIFIIIHSCAMPIKAHADIVSIAQGEIGKGEMYGNNKGPEVEKYTKGQDVAWCAGFVSWTIQKATGKGLYLLSANSYWKIYKSKRVRSPKRGDIICFYRGGRGSNHGHVGIVKDVRGNRLTTIEGNVGKFPAKVKYVHYDINHVPNLLGYIRL